MLHIFLSGFLVLGQAQEADAGQAAPTAVQARMRSSFQGLMGLQPYLSTPSVFSDPKNKSAILSSFDALSSVKHAFPKKMAQEEPGVAAISHLSHGTSMKPVRALKRVTSTTPAIACAP